MKTMSQVKVNQVESFKDSQTNTTVCKGKLVIIPSDFGDVNNTSNGLFTKPYVFTIPKKGELNMASKALIISETEEIEEGNNIYTFEESDFPNMSKCINLKRFNLGDPKAWRKVLVLSEQFSPKHLQAIVDQKLKDGDEVYVECYKVLNTDIIKGKDFNNYILKPIKLFPVKKEEKLYTKEEVKVKFLEFVKDCDYNEDLLCNYEGDYRDLDKWIKDNL
jgi:hypothetical protein